jgi:hypothetical protein
MASVAISGAASTHTASADGGVAAVIAVNNAAIMNAAPRRMPCGFSGVPDDRCPGARADLASPTCQTILDRLGKADRADWHRRRDLVETAKRTGCVPYQR